MSLFNFGKKKEEKGECCCGSDCNSDTMAKAEARKTEGAAIKVLGSGCSKCDELEKATKEALKQLDMDDSVEHVTDFVQIASYGIMSTPALVIDGKVVSYGKVLKVEEVKNIIQKIRK